LYSSPHYLPFSLERLISVGRHRDLALFVTSRRPHSLHPLLRSQANEIVSFRQIEPRDLSWLSDVMGERYSERVKTLPKYAFVRWREEDALEEQDPNEASPAWYNPGDKEDAPGEKEQVSETEDRESLPGEKE